MEQLFAPGSCLNYASVISVVFQHPTQDQDFIAIPAGVVCVSKARDKPL
jgi:hypothetical protein